MKRYALLASLALFLAACSGNRQEAGTKQVQPHDLGSNSIFNKDAVLQYTADFPEETKEAGKLFLEAVDQYRNKKNPGKAQELFLQSLAKYPTSRAYYELGNVCIDQKKYAEAVVAFEMAETIGYQPLSKLLYNMACAYSLLQKPDTARRYLEYAIEAGYSNTDNMTKDPDLAFVRTDNEYLFKEVYTSALSGSSDPEVLLWQTFKREFEPVALPLVLNEETRKRLDEKSYISFDFEKFISEMRDNRFSREVGKEFYHLAQVESNERYTALVYAVVDGVMGEDAPAGYVLISFDGRGRLIDKMHVGGQVEYGGLSKVATLQPNLHFEVKEYKTIYEKDPEEDGYYDNKVVSRELLGNKNYRISENGKFEADRPALSMR